MTEKKRRVIRSQGIKKENPQRGVDWTQRPWQELFALRDPLVREGIELERKSIALNAMDEPDSVSSEMLDRRLAAWERVGPTAEAMETLGWPNPEIVWWILSGHESTTFTLQTSIFCELLQQLAALVQERETFVPAKKTKKKSGKKKGKKHP